jgi:3-hydroxyisobutyrate dehydrogenase-like beta-hydroxyacid dehydrogenase
LKSKFKAHKLPVGVIGLGIMGSAMAANLMRAGYRVIGYDVVDTRRRSLARAGGVAARSCRAVGDTCGVVICSLPSSGALLKTVDGLGEIRSPHVVIETSTLPIDVKDIARKRLASDGTVLLDCPLSGTGSQARTRDLVVYASGDRRAYRQVTPVLDAIARAHYHVGPFGNGSKTKFVANLLVAIHNVAAAEALVLAEKAGLDPKTTLRVVADGAGSSRMLEVRGPLMVTGNYSKALMKLDVWSKDMGIIGAFARASGASTPLFDATTPLYAAATRSDGGEDTAAVHRVLAESTKYKVQSRK